MYLIFKYFGFKFVYLFQIEIDFIVAVFAWFFIIKSIYIWNCYNFEILILTCLTITNLTPKRSKTLFLITNLSESLASDHTEKCSLSAKNNNKNPSLWKKYLFYHSDQMFWPLRVLKKQRCQRSQNSSLLRSPKYSPFLWKPFWQ